MTEHTIDFNVLDATLRKVLSENTAQAVFKHLGDLENKRSLIMSRWVWELMQNGRDVAKDTGLAVELAVEQEQLNFRHNGRPFNDEEIAHLIYHGSTKQTQSDSIGHFGSGFISTHLISKQVRVRGRMEDGNHFEFILDRNGNSPEALSDVMDKSWDEFKKSLTINSDNADGDYTTEFTYFLTSEPNELIDSGLLSLRICAPYVLAFNSNIASISIKQGQTIIFRKSEEQVLDSPISITTVTCTAEDNVNDLYVAVASKDSVSVAAQLRTFEGGFATDLDQSTPRIFLAFPLSGTESFCFPTIINSELFGPREDRDGIYLAIGENEVNEQNQQLFRQACGLLQELVVFASSQHWKDAHVLAMPGTFEKKEWFKEEWLKKTINEDLIQKLRHSNIVTSLGGGEVCPKDAWLPIENGASKLEDLWDLTASLREAQSKLPIRTVARDWSVILERWSTFCDKSSEDVTAESWTVEKLARHTSDAGTLSNLGQLLVQEADPIHFLNELHRIILAAGLVRLFDELNLLPNQNGDFKKRNDELFRESHIGSKLKEIAEKLGLDMKGKLLHTGIISNGLSELLRPKIESEVLSEVLEELNRQSAENSHSVDFCQANFELFSWAVERDAAYLEGFPVIMASSEDDEVTIKYLSNKALDQQERVLSPPECWPQLAQEYAHLFPRQYILSTTYYEYCPRLEIWEKLDQQGYLHLVPIYTTRESLNAFLPDSILPEIGKRETDHETKREVDVTTIAFLDKKDIGLIDTARKSKSKAIDLIRFLLLYVIEQDSTAFDELDAECECDQIHRYYRAGWLIPLRIRKWIPTGKGKSDYPSAESLSALLEDSGDVSELFGEKASALLIKALGISVADLIFRTVTSDEGDRVVLSQYAAEMFKATGKNKGRIKSLTEEISAHPEILDQIEERKRIRERVYTNQRVGGIVETLLAQALRESKILVERTGVGSDFTLEAEPDPDAHDTRLELNKSGISFLLEVKATTGFEARLTPKQAETAVKNVEHFIVCMVKLPSSDVSEDDVIRGARFVFNIGTQLQPLWDEYDFVRTAIKDAETQRNDIELVMTEFGTRFKIGDSIWRSGMRFGEAIKYFKNV